MTPTRLLPYPRVGASSSSSPCGRAKNPELLGRVFPCLDGGSGSEFFSAGGDAGESVELTVAESSGDFDELSGGGPRDVARLYALVP